jgi:hypothetical protein
MNLKVKYNQQISVARTCPDRQQTAARDMSKSSLIGRYTISKNLQLPAHSLSYEFDKSPSNQTQTPGFLLPQNSTFLSAASPTAP